MLTYHMQMAATIMKLADVSMQRVARGGSEETDRLLDQCQIIYEDSFISLLQDGAQYTVNGTDFLINVDALEYSLSKDIVQGHLAKNEYEKILSQDFLHDTEITLARLPQSIRNDVSFIPKDCPVSDQNLGMVVAGMMRVYYKDYKLPDAYKDLQVSMNAFQRQMDYNFIQQERMELQIKKTSKVNKDLKIQLASTNKDKAELEEKLSESEKRISEITNELTEKENLIASQKTDIEKLTKASEAFRNDIAKKNENIKELQGVKNKLSEEISSIKASLNSKDEKIKALQLSVTNLTSKLTNSETRIKTVKGELESEHRNQIQKLTNDYEAKIKSITSDHESEMNTLIDSSNKEIIDLRDSYEKELKEAKNKIEELSLEIERLREGNTVKHDNDGEVYLSDILGNEEIAPLTDDANLESLNGFLGGDDAENDSDFGDDADSDATVDDNNPGINLSEINTQDILDENDNISDNYSDIFEDGSEPIAEKPETEKVDETAETPNIKYGDFPQSDNIRSMKRDDFTYTYLNAQIYSGEIEITGFEAFIIPLSTKEQLPDLLVWIGHNNQTATYTSTKDKKAVIATINNFQIMFTGRMEGDEFKASVFFADNDIANSYQLSFSQHSGGKKGHILMTETGIKVHIAPVTFRNNEEGYANFAYVIDDENGYRSGDNAYSNVYVRTYEERLIQCSWNESRTLNATFGLVEQ